MSTRPTWAVEFRRRPACSILPVVGKITSRVRGSRRPEAGNKSLTSCNLATHRRRVDNVYCPDPNNAAGPYFGNPPERSTNWAPPTEPRP